MKSPHIITITLLLSIFAFSGMAQADKLEREPGYYDLDWIEIPDGADEVQDIDLSAILKSVAKDAQENGDDNLAEILKMVRSIRVKGFSMDDADAEQVTRDVDKVVKDLKKKDWKRLVYMKDKEEMLSISTKHDGEDLVGLMVVAYQPGEEALFANVVGDLDLPTLLALVGGMDSEGIGELLEELEDLEIEFNTGD